MFLSKDKSVLVDGSGFSLAEDLVEDYYIVPEPLANKVKVNHPYYDLVLDSDGNLIDVMPTEKPPEPDLLPPEPSQDDYLLDLDYRISMIELGL